MTFRDLLNLLSRSCFPVKMLDENIHAAICLIHLQFPVFRLVHHQIILGFNLRIILVLDEYKLFIEQFLVFSCFFLECYKNIFDLRTSQFIVSLDSIYYSSFPVMWFTELFLFLLQMPLIPIYTGILMKVVINANACTVGLVFGFFVFLITKGH